MVIGMDSWWQLYKAAILEQWRPAVRNMSCLWSSALLMFVLYVLKQIRIGLQIHCSLKPPAAKEQLVCGHPNK